MGKGRIYVILGLLVILFALVACSKAPQARFQVDLASGSAPLTVLFTDKSSNAQEWEWDFGDGATSSEKNPSHSYTKAGTFLPSLTIARGTGEKREVDIFSLAASITVSPGPLSRVLVSPEVFSLTPQKSQTLSAKGVDQFGNEIEGLSFTWDATAGGGTVDPNGIFIAGTKAGKYQDTVRVTAQQGDITRFVAATVTVQPDALDHALVSPEALDIRVTESHVFAAVGLDQYDNVVPEVSFRWSAESGGTVDTGGLFTAGSKAGEFKNAIKVEATQGGITKSTQVSVTLKPGALSTVKVLPKADADKPAVLAIGKSLEFAAHGFDRFENSISDIPIQWKVREGIGSITKEGLFTAGTQAGDFAQGITATSIVGGATATGSAAVTVLPDPLDAVSFTTSQIEVVAGGTYQLLANAVDKYGNKVKEVQLTWSISSPRAGKLDDKGILTAGTSAQSFTNVFLVEAKQGELKRAASASLVILPGPLDKVAVGPSAVDVGIGRDQQIVAVGKDKYGNTIPGLAIKWSLVGGSFGTIDGKGVFMAGNIPGTFADSIKAEAGEGAAARSATASITVQPDRIAFLSDRDGQQDGYDIYLINTDGSQATRLTSKGDVVGSSSWSPDGRRLVYEDTNGVLFVLDVVIGTATRLATLESKMIAPSWSPDGAKIAFNSYEEGEDDWEIYVISSDGTNLIKVTENTGQDYFPSWSSDSRRLLFESNRSGNYDIWIMDADGKNPQQLTSHPATDLFPRFSPDGSKIAFDSNRDGDREIFVMNANGTGIVQLTSNFVGDGDPSWSEDGTKVLFTSFRDGNNEVYIMNAGGTSQSRLTSSSSSDFSAEWAPRRRGVGVLVLPRPTPVSALPASPGTVEGAVALIKPAVVRITVTLSNGTATGTGMVFDSNGLILTNNHVVSGVQSITVELDDGRKLPGKLLGTDALRDMAVVKIDATGLPTIAFGESADLPLGRTVIAFGFALGLQGTASASQGIVSGIRTFTGIPNAAYIQTDATINPGNSGGPLIDLQGRVIGMNTFKLVGAGVEGAGFSLSVDTIRAFLSALIDGQVITSSTFVVAAVP